MLIAIEGIDQSGKATLAAALAERTEEIGLPVRRLAFPDYETPVGGLIGAMLRGETPHNSMLMQLLCSANRFEKLDRLQDASNGRAVVICDRYTASALAYGSANGVAEAWLRSVESPLPEADATILLDADPEATRKRKTAARDRYERDIELLKRVQAAYLRLGDENGWIVVNGAQSADAVAEEAWERLDGLLGTKQRSAARAARTSSQRADR